jgi:hypothetical protein
MDYFSECLLCDFPYLTLGLVFLCCRYRIIVAVIMTVAQRAVGSEISQIKGVGLHEI